MHVILTIIVFIILLALLVLAHEFGHFIVAKKSGMQVEEFGFGFPPRIFAVRKGETIYSVNAVPLGGFVKIMGENNDGAENPRSFINKGFWARFFTLTAGVIMNFILAWILFSIGFGIGLPAVVSPGDRVPAHARLTAEHLTVLDVAGNSPAQQAGLQQGDEIISYDSQPAVNADKMVAYIQSKAGNTVRFDFQRGSENFTKDIFSRPDPPSDQGSVGIAFGTVGRLSYPWYLAPIAGLRGTWQVISQTAVAFYQLVIAGSGLSSLGGPVKIASLTGQVTQLGFVYVLQFAAFLSVNLGIINIIPFPALDGGRVLFLLIEKARRKRNNQKIEQWANTIGFALLIGLIIIITFKDVGSLVH